MNNIFAVILLLLTSVLPSTASGDKLTQGNGYVARNESVSSLLEAMGYYLTRPVVISKMAARKQVSGRFDFDDDAAQTLDQLSRKLGLIWYSDGTTIYVYDAGEMRNAVITLQTMTLERFNAFLQSSGLYDVRYKIKGQQNLNTFYVSGPPVYVNLILDAVKLIDKKNDDIELGLQKISIVRLNNTFVNDRSYELRGQKVIIPGMATVIEHLLENENKIQSSPDMSLSDTLPVPIRDSPEGISEINLPTQFMPTAPINVKVIPYQDTNSILVKGTTEQVSFIEKLVTALDVPKRHIELSLWIIDIDKSNLDQLGVNWSGAVKVGDQFGIEFNKTGAISTLDGSEFLASIQALERKKRAFVISRPVLLVQENVPAIFDNNRTFYAKLIGERTSSLEQVTWGTLISVIPRFSARGEIEMNLNIEDGKKDNSNLSVSNDVLPEVGRTLISTVARVPQGKSLLIGGYTRDASTTEEAKIPLLGDIPLIGSLFTYKGNNNNNTVRVFLIHPREIKESLNDVPFESGQEEGLSSEQMERWIKSYLNR